MVEEQRWLLQSFLTSVSTFWCVSQYLILLIVIWGYSAKHHFRRPNEDEPQYILWKQLFKNISCGRLKVRRKEIILEAGPSSDCGQCNKTLFLHIGTRRMLLSARSEGLLGAFSGNLQQKATLESRWCKPESHGCCLRFRNLWQAFGCWPICLISLYLLWK